MGFYLLTRLRSASRISACNYPVFSARNGLPPRGAPFRFHRGKSSSRIPNELREFEKQKHNCIFSNDRKYFTRRSMPWPISWDITRLLPRRPPSPAPLQREPGDSPPAEPRAPPPPGNGRLFARSGDR